jgi:hypothetical protein
MLRRTNKRGIKSGSSYLKLLPAEVTTCEGHCLIACFFRHGRAPTIAGLETSPTFQMGLEDVALREFTYRTTYSGLVDSVIVLQTRSLLYLALEGIPHFPTTQTRLVLDSDSWHALYMLAMTDGDDSSELIKLYTLSWHQYLVLSTLSRQTSHSIQPT